MRAGCMRSSLLQHMHTYHSYECDLTLARTTGAWKLYVVVILAPSDDQRYLFSACTLYTDLKNNYKLANSTWTVYSFDKRLMSCIILLCVVLVTRYNQLHGTAWAQQLVMCIVCLSDRTSISSCSHACLLMCTVAHPPGSRAPSGTYHFTQQHH